MDDVLVSPLERSTALLGVRVFQVGHCDFFISCREGADLIPIGSVVLCKMSSLSAAEATTYSLEVIILSWSEFG